MHQGNGPTYHPVCCVSLAICSSIFCSSAHCESAPTASGYSGTLGPPGPKQAGEAAYPGR